MSRKYLNERWCVRCHKEDPTPYLRDNIAKLGLKNDTMILDLGCGNGRNTKFLNLMGYKNVHPIDMAGDFGTKLVLGVDLLPFKDKSIGAIMCNYVFMFLNQKERNCLLKEIKRVASAKCKIMIELYPAKDSETKDKEESIKLQEDLFKKLGWKKIKYSQNRFIATNE